MAAERLETSITNAVPIYCARRQRCRAAIRTINLLTKEECTKVSIRLVLSRIRNKGAYSDLTVNYGPKIMQDWGVTGNNLRGVMADAFAWVISEDEVPKFTTPDRTTVSRMAVARCTILKDDIQSLLESDEVTFINSMADGSIRAKLPHEPVAATCSSKFEVHRIVIKDSVLAGKTGKSQAQYVFGAFSEKARRKLGGIMYDTTSSNTGFCNKSSWFLQQKFVHQYVHQMWLEGAFNVMDHNHVNVTLAVTCASPSC